MYLKSTIIFLTLVAYQALAVGNASPQLDSRLKKASPEFEANLNADFESEPGITYLTRSLGFTGGYVSGKYHTEESIPVGNFGLSISANTPIDAHELSLSTLGSKVISIGYNYSLNMFEGIRFKPSAIIGLSENILASDGIGGFFNINELQLNAGLGAEWQLRKNFHLSPAESIRISALMSAGLKYTNIKLNLTYLFYWK